MDEQQFCTAAGKVYEIVELREMIFDKCDWASLVSLAHTCQHCRITVHNVLRKRIQQLLKPWVDSNNQCSFFAALEEANGMVVGGVVRCMMSKDSPGCPRSMPTQLDVIIADEDQGVVSLLGDVLGYDEVFGPPNKLFDRGICRGYRRFVKDGQALVLYRSASDSPVPVLYSAMCSSHLFALTSTTFACYYPKLFAQKEHFPLREEAIMERVLPFDYFWEGLMPASDDFCEIACPVVWRRSGLALTGIMRWGGIKGNNAVSQRALNNEPFADKGYMFRRDVRWCGNEGCDHYARAVDLEDWGYKWLSWGTPKNKTV